jgi:hypothetical protein
MTAMTITGFIATGMTGGVTTIGMIGGGMIGTTIGVAAETNASATNR